MTISQREYAQVIYDNILKQGCLKITDSDKKLSAMEKVMKSEILQLIANAATETSASQDNMKINYIPISSKNLTSATNIIAQENTSKNIDILFTFFAEDHTNASDKARVVDYMTKNSTMTHPLTACVLERGLDYDLKGFSGDIIKEENLSNVSGPAKSNWVIENLSIKLRSLLVAGYLILYSHNYTGVTRPQHIVVFFGENHVDIFQYFKTLINSSGTSIKDKKIDCVLVPSNNGKTNLLAALT